MALEDLDRLFWCDGPRPELADRLALFAPLIGSWHLKVTNHLPDGGCKVVDGEWHFGWALDGRAVADVWIMPSRASRAEQGDGEWGLSVRFFDPSIDAWRSTWLGPKHAVVMPFTLHPENDELVLESRFTDDATTRWVFSGITDGSFQWRAEEILDGERPLVQQEFAATRMT